MNVAVLFSGGKDSCLATWYALHQGWTVTRLLTAQPRTVDSWMFHYPTTEWVKLQAQAIGIPLHLFQPSEGEQSELRELSQALGELKKDGVEAVVSGAVASDYQRRRIDHICHELHLFSFAPLWQKDPRLLLRELLALKFEIYITGVSTMGLDTSWLGRLLDESAMKELLTLSERYFFHSAGEGGEYETFVTDGPFFHKKICLGKTRKIVRGSTGHLVIEEASLTDKI